MKPFNFILVIIILISCFTANILAEKNNFVPTSTTSSAITPTNTITSTIMVTNTIWESTTITTFTTSTIYTTPTSLPYNRIYFEKPTNWNSNNIRAYTYYQDSTEVRENIRWPGEKMTTDTDNSNIYVIKIDKNLNLNRVIFNDGSNQSPKSGQSGYEIKDLALYNINGYNRQYYDKCGDKSSNTITIYYYTNWKKAYIHYQYGSNPWTIAPGKAMTLYKDGYQMITIDIGKDDIFTFVCNNDSGEWDNNYGRNYLIKSPGSYILKNGQLSSGSI